MSEISYKKIATDGLWSNNPGLVQLLGLCPLLAVSSTTVNGFGLGLATMFVLAATNTVISMIRNVVRPELRLPVFVLLIASIVTAVQLAISAYTPELYKVLGIFIPLIVTNCIVIGRAEAFASRQSPPRALWDGLTMGLGFAAVLILLGALREILGKGTLFAGAGIMFGPSFSGLEVTVIEHYRGFLLAILPPGAFFALASLIVVKNMIDARNTKKTATKTVPIDAATATN